MAKSEAFEHEILEKLKDLPQERLAEVEDFIDFLRQRHEGGRLTMVAMKLSENAFAEVWDNPEDGVYDEV